MLFARSPKPERGILAQDYAKHIGGVVDLSMKAASEIARYASYDGELLKHVVQIAAEYHDLGKLDDENQKVLSGQQKANRLPIQHSDAGTAHALDNLAVAAAAAVIRSHHIGLPDFIKEANRDEGSVLRDDFVRERVNQTLSKLVELHERAITPRSVPHITNLDVVGNPSLFFRLALSCLADGDHTDSSMHNGDHGPKEPRIELRPAERLAALDIYVEKLKDGNARSLLRTELYDACRDANIQEAISSCDSPVGTGKTTAIMAHLLSQAEARRLRRIFVILPYTNIIQQSVATYRKALVLPGENPKLVVAELHHRADFEDDASRQLTALWESPIVVTTAVAFFETLASNAPATLRRLHNLPGSAVFIDESHAMLPSNLLPTAWHWIKIFASEWACYWVLASGSLNRFWQIQEFDKETPRIPEVVPDDLRVRLGASEKRRVDFQSVPKPFEATDLATWVAALPGPRLVIINTVQSAAAVALEYARLFGRHSVEHLSTALTPLDRGAALDRIRTRLADSNDSGWTLIATSCAEAGLDFSFKTGVREAASLVSLLQTSGRVNRHECVNTETVWSVLLREGGLLIRHPGMACSARVLLEILAEGNNISPDLCTMAMKREIRLSETISDSLLEFEKDLRFPKVEENFRVIASDTKTVVVGDELIGKLEKHQKVHWQDIQRSSVQIWGYRLDDLRLPEVLGYPGVYKWTYDYNNFIGYMAGFLSVEAFKHNVGKAFII